jgi:aspartate/methionine/tyrosine aminotransferase
MSPIRPAIRNLASNGIAQVAGLGLGDPDIVPLWFGESDLVTPRFIRDAAKQALDDGKTFYSGQRGIPQLRHALRDFHKRTLGVDIAFERISLPGAATLAMVTALQCLIEKGDNIVIVSPIWPSIFEAAIVAGAEVRYARLEEDWQTSRWHLDLEKLLGQCDARTKAIFVCSPGNPTGWVMTREEQKTMLDFARKRGIAIISDEVYGTLVFDGSVHAPSFLQIADAEDNLFVVNSFSKPWAMTGWRIGWLTHPSGVADQLAAMTQYINSGTPGMVQAAALAAIRDGEPLIEEIRGKVKAGLDLAYDKLPQIPGMILPEKPRGGMYAFFALEGEADARAACARILEKARVGLAPGYLFGDSSRAFLRMCVFRDIEQVRTALDRMVDAMK